MCDFWYRDGSACALSILYLPYENWSATREVELQTMQPVPEYSSESLKSNMVITFPLRWLTSTSPSRFKRLSILTLISPSSAEMPTNSSVRYDLVHSETSLFTQCQLLGL